MPPIRRHVLSARGTRRFLRVASVTVMTAAIVVAVTGPAAAADETGTQRLTTIIGNATGWLIGILAAVATLFLTIGGVRYVLAGGDPGEIEKAKGSFRSAILGYALAALAPVVVVIVRGILGLS